MKAKRKLVYLLDPSKLFFDEDPYKMDDSMFKTESLIQHQVYSFDLFTDLFNFDETLSGKYFIRIL